MAKILRTRGFSRGGFGQVLHRGSISRFDVPGYEFENTPVDCKMRFDRVLMMYDSENGRPYLQFVEGRIKSAVLDVSEIKEFDFDHIEISLDELCRPEVNMRWDLNNQELQSLVGKGLFGFDYDFDHADGVNPKPLRRGPIPIPEIFTSNDIDMTVDCDIRILAVNDKVSGKVVPIAGIYPCDAFLMRTNSRVSGYEDISQYFGEPEFLSAGDYSEEKEADAGDRLYINRDDILFSKEADKHEPSKLLRRAEMEHKADRPMHMMTKEERVIADLVEKTREKVAAAEAERERRLEEMKSASKSDEPKAASDGVKSASSKKDDNHHSGMLASERVTMENEFMSLKDYGEEAEF